MKDDILADRRKALEEEFFRKQDQRLIERLRSIEGKKALQEALTRVGSHISEPVLDKLIALGVTAETIASLALVPLVAVAWADGTIEKKEKEAILKAAEEGGIKAGTAGHALLEAWLSRKPHPSLVHAWEEYTKRLVSDLTPAEAETLKADILGRARQVADAAGGFFRIGVRVSAAEREELKRLAAAFDHRPHSAG